MPASEPRYSSAHPSCLLADVNGVTLAYECLGNPQHPPLLMIMGLGCQLVHWDTEFCQQLAAQGFYVIRFDNRDIGLSTKLDEFKPSLTKLAAHYVFKAKISAPYQLDDMAADSLALMDHLNIPSAHLMGVSMGGMIAQLLAIQAPQRVRSLMSIMSTTGAKRLPGPTRATSALLARKPPKHESDFLQHAKGIWQHLHGTHFPFEEERVMGNLQTAYRRCFHPPGVLRQLMAITAAADRSEALKSLTMPVTVIHGDADPLVPLANGTATARAISHAKFRIIPGLGHTLPSALWPIFIEELQAMAAQV